MIIFLCIFSVFMPACGVHTDILSEEGALHTLRTIRTKASEPSPSLVSKPKGGQVLLLTRFNPVTFQVHTGRVANHS